MFVWSKALGQRLEARCYSRPHSAVTGAAGTLLCTVVVLRERDCHDRPASHNGAVCHEGFFVRLWLIVWVGLGWEISVCRSLRDEVTP